MNKIILYLNTLYYLKMSQLVWRLIRKLYKVKNPKFTRINLARGDFCQGKVLFPFPEKVTSISSDGLVWLLNKKFNAEDFLSSNSSISKLEYYNFYYFDFFNADVSPTASKIILLHEFLEKFSASVTDIPTEAFDAYPISLRIVNLSKFLFFNIKNISDDFFGLIISVIAFDSSILVKKIEYETLGNHIFSNAKALIFASVVLDGFKKNHNMRSVALDLFFSQLKEQTLADGGNFELSPMYHNIFVEDLLDLFNLLHGDNSTDYFGVCDSIRAVLPKMLEWSFHMSRPSGTVAFFNDSTDHVASNYNDLVLYNERMNCVSYRQPDKKSVYLEESGYFCFYNDHAKLIFDAAKVGPDYIPGHAHADTLSFELYVWDFPVFVNTGTSIYGVSDLRNHQRGTRSHNTLMLGMMNSSQVWAGFRVGKRAKCFVDQFDLNNNSVTAWHDGYNYLLEKFFHERHVCMREGGGVIFDNVVGKGKKYIEINFHLHPSITPELMGEKVILKHPRGCLYMSTESKLSCEIHNYEYAAGFNLTEASYKICFSGVVDLPYSTEFMVNWHYEN